MEKHCRYCGDYAGKYELCKECYYLAQEEYIIKNEKGIWTKNIRKGNEFKFYDKNKTYKLKINLLNEYEMKFFDIVRFSLNNKYVIIPQVNLQSIVETNTNTRNDELYRNIDFMLFHTDDYIPFLAIELNGQQHYTNEYWKERDKSVKSILQDIGIPLLTIDIQDLAKLKDNEIYNLINKTIKYLNPNAFVKLFSKPKDKMDLSWTKKLIKKEQ